MAKKANWRGLHAGDEVALSFTEGEAVVRLALARVAESRWVTLSTDEEYLVEDLSECRRGSLYRLGPRGGLPAVYRNECPSGTFDREWLRDNRDQALREGERLARRQRKKDAKDEPEQEDEESEEESSEEEDDDESDGEEEEEEPPAKAKKKGKAAKAGKKAQSAAAAVPKSRPPVPSGFPAGWIALEKRGGLSPGDALPGTAVVKFYVDDRAVVEIGGTYVSAGKAGTLEKVVAPSPAVVDVRILDVTYHRDGVSRQRTFASAVDDCFSPASRPKDWPIEGPSSAPWLVGQMRDTSTTPRQRHHWWRQILGLGSADPGVDDHQFLSELLEVGLTYDMLNAGAVAIMEMVARRYQLWEEVHSEALRIAEMGEGGADFAEERRLFLGLPRGRASALVMPALKDHIATEVAKEAAVLKERRKAREERQLVAGGGLTGAAATVPLRSAPPAGRGKKH